MGTHTRLESRQQSLPLAVMDGVVLRVAKRNIADCAWEQGAAEPRVMGSSVADLHSSVRLGAGSQEVWVLSMALTLSHCMTSGIQIPW